jgi:hypothetical protein
MSEADKIKTPSGLTMGKRVMKHGKPCMEYRREGHTDVMTPEVVVERITGVKVKAIIYEADEESA